MKNLNNLLAVYREKQNIRMNTRMDENDPESVKHYDSLYDAIDVAKQEYIQAIKDNLTEIKDMKIIDFIKNEVNNYPCFKTLNYNTNYLGNYGTKVGDLIRFITDTVIYKPVYLMDGKLVVYVYTGYINENFYAGDSAYGIDGANSND